MYENEGPRITAQEPRNMYAEGQLVRNTVDGSRPGYQGKNQFTGNNPLNIKQSTYDLIPQIKEDAKTMSQIEIEKRYKIHKKTLKKIKDAENIKFRTTYLPEGTQEKSKPYAERYTAEEKSEMYKARKGRETEADRIRARERDQKYRDKIYKDYKMEPSSRTSYDDLWKDITRSSKEGDRIKLIEGPKYSSGASYDDFKKRVFLDTKTGEKFNYNTLKNYLDSGKLEGVTYKSAIEPYDLKWQINKSGLREEIQKAYFGEKYKPPSRFRAQNTFHVHHISGVAADPFKVQLTFADQNLGLVHNKKFNENWAKLIERNAPLSERKEYLKFVKSKIGPNIAQTLEFPEVGKTRTFGEIGTDIQKLLSDERLKIGPKEQKKLLDQISKTFKEKGMKLRKGEAGFIATDILKDAGKLGPKSLRLLSSEWVWPEIVIGWLDKQNNIQKGMSPERASSEMWKNMTLGLRDKGETENAILGQLKKLGYGEKDIKAAEHMMRYGKLSKEIEKTKTGIESMELGMAEQGSAEGAQQLREKLENLKKEQESVAGFYFGAIGDKDANYGYELYDQASKELMRTEWNRSLEDRKKRTDPYAGQMGSEFQEIFAMTPDWSETKEKIAAMSPEELDKWNLQERGIGYERVHPMYGAAMSGKQMEPLRDQMGYMYAGGGIVGIRKPSAIAPTGGPMSQGLRSLYIDDKDY